MLIADYSIEICTRRVEPTNLRNNTGGLRRDLTSSNVLTHPPREEKEDIDSSVFPGVCMFCRPLSPVDAMSANQRDIHKTTVFLALEREDFP